MAGIDKFRKRHMAVAEFIDAWRLVPRALVVGYGVLFFNTVKWYKDLQPYMLEGCVGAARDCIVQAPTTQHAALVTAVVGVSAAVFGLYANSGKKWNGFTYWDKPEKKTDEKADEEW